MEDIYIRSYQPGDEEEIVKLLKIVFEGWPAMDLSCSPEDHWRWKYLDNPLRSKIINLAISDDKIIGVDHSIPVRVKIGDRFSLINYAADLAVHPDFRKRGVAKRLIDMTDLIRKEIDVPCIYFVTSRPFLIQKYSKPFPFPILNLVRIQDLNEHLKVIPVKNPSIMKLGFHTSKILNNTQNIFRGSFSSDKDMPVTEVKKFDEKFDDFFDEVSKHYKFIIERRHQYLNWRFCDARAGNFITKKVEEKERILGYSVLRINKYLKHYPIGFIVDLLTLPNYNNVADLLVSEAIQYFDKNNVNIINCQVIKGHPYENVLKRRGLLDSRLKFHLITNLKQIGKENVLKDSLPKEIYFSYGDIDTLPVRMPLYV